MPWDLILITVHWPRIMGTRSTWSEAVSGAWGWSPAPLNLPLFPAALAAKHMDLKQLELDTAAAKVDELSKQLESLWTDHPGQSAGPPPVRAGHTWPRLPWGCVGAGQGLLGCGSRGTCGAAGPQ